MGFRTLTIQQRSSEVWKMLGDVKLQFSKYSQVLANIRTKLEQATKTVDEAAQRTRVIEKQLKNIETADEQEEIPMLHLIAVNGPE
jgi:DNA recombination protein RmuC